MDRLPAQRVQRIFLSLAARPTTRRTTYGTGNSPEPTAAIHRCAKHAQGGDPGFDADEKVKERKPSGGGYIGLLLAITITAASVQNRDAAAPVVGQACAKLPELKKLYGGQRVVDLEKAIRSIRALQVAYGSHRI